MQQWLIIFLEITALLCTLSIAQRQASQSDHSPVGTDEDPIQDAPSPVLVKQKSREQQQQVEGVAKHSQDSGQVSPETGGETSDSQEEGAAGRGDSEETDKGVHHCVPSSVFVALNLKFDLSFVSHFHSIVCWWLVYNYTKPQ